MKIIKIYDILFNSNNDMIIKLRNVKNEEFLKLLIKDIIIKKLVTEEAQYKLVIELLFKYSILF